MEILNKRLSTFARKSFKESVTSTSIIVKSGKRVEPFRRIKQLLVFESKAKWSCIKQIRDKFIARMGRMHARHRRGIASSEVALRDMMAALVGKHASIKYSELKGFGSLNQETAMIELK